MKMATKAMACMVALALPGLASAQAFSCKTARAIPRPRPDLPDASQPARNLPIGGYTLALTWAPQYCHEHGRDRDERFRCASGNRFGFTLHGLWPDGVGKEWPQYCAAAPILPRQLIAQHICATPSAQLMQHEYAKHGTCMGRSPEAYFARSTSLYGALRYPDMMALSRRQTNAGDIAAAFAAANPGLPANAIRVTANRSGWLDEMWLCLDRRFAYEACKPGSGGLPAGARVKIWRGMQ